MSHRARSTRSNRSVSLFPFLAVLVCAMGALIFLLLITTRRIRQQAIAHVQPVPQVTIEPEPVAEVLPVIAPEPPSIVAPPDDADDQAAELARQQRQADREALISQWETNVETLKTERATLQTSLDEMRKTAETAAGNLQQLTSTFEQTERERERLTTQTTVARAAQQELLNRYETISTAINRAEESLKTLQTDHAHAASRYSIVPYDGRTGTTRRPIIIECRADGLRFASEDVSLSARDVTGFTPRMNPLRAGVRALAKYWFEIDREKRMTSKAAMPYVLLVVRPDGTEAYYTARRLLTGDKIPSGYELVGANQEFAWPETTPEAEGALRSAVAAMMVQKPQIEATFGGGRDGIGSFRNRVDELVDVTEGGGGFRNKEFDELRTLSDKEGAYVNGRRWSRPSGNTGIAQPGMGTRQPQNGATDDSQGAQQMYLPNQGAPGDVSSSMPSRMKELQLAQSGAKNGTLREADNPFLLPVPASGEASTNGSPTDSSPTDGRFAQRENEAHGRFDPGFQGGINRADDAGESSDAGSLAATPGDSNSGRPAAWPHTPRRSGEAQGASSGGSAFADPVDAAVSQLLAQRKLAEQATPPVSADAAPRQSATEVADTVPETSPVERWLQAQADRKADAQDSALGQSSMSSMSATSGAARRSAGAGDADARFRSRTGLNRRRQWGIHNPRGSIGFEREVIVDVSPDQFRIEEEPPQTAGTEVSAQLLQARIERDLDRHARTWGAPSSRFYWVPTVRIVAQPDAGRTQQRVSSAVQHLGLRHVVRFTQAQPTPAEARR